MPESPDRTVVIGCTGSGKSTFAATLAARTGAVHIRRDELGPEGSDRYRAAVAAAVAGDRWVFDGAPYYADDLVYPRATLIVGFDLPRRTVMRRVIARSMRESLGLAPAPPHRDRRWRAWRHPEHPVRWAWSTWTERHHELDDLLASGIASGASVVSFSTPCGVTAWLAQRDGPG
jgi:adenylate kinase family enzyme